MLFWAILTSSSLQAQCDSSYFSTMLKAGSWIGSTVLGMVEISPEQESKIGNEMFSYASENFDLIEEGEQFNKLQEILARLIPYVSRKEIAYRIHLVDDDELINAFSICGGHIFVTTGIMQWVESEDELAFIVGHEISHIDLEHCVRNVKKSAAIQSWADFFEVGEYAGVIEQAQTVLATPFGQPDEYASDQMGAYLCKKAAYNPSKGIDFFKKLSAEEDKEEVPYQLDLLIRTHPYSDQRIVCLDSFIKNGLNE